MGDGVSKVVDGSLCLFFEKGLELGNGQFDGLEVGAVGQLKPQQPGHRCSKCVNHVADNHSSEYDRGSRLTAFTFDVCRVAQRLLQYTSVGSPPGACMRHSANLHSVYGFGCVWRFVFE